MFTLQPLDIGVFHEQKSEMSRMKVNRMLSAQTIQLKRMLDTFTQAVSVSNVVSAFRGAGIRSHYDLDDDWAI